MSKKMASLLLTMVLLCTTMTAFAATPSKTTKDLNKVVKNVVANGTDQDALIWVKDIPSTFVTQQIADVAAFVAKKNKIKDYYPVETQTEISGVLPPNTDLSTLILSEFVDLGIGDYQESIGDVTSTITFATVFKPTQTVVAVIGYPDETGNTVWQVLQTTVVDGMLQIVFPTELMLKVGHDAVLSILSVQ